MSIMNMIIISIEELHTEFLVRHPGEGRGPPLPWFPAFAGMTG